MNILSKKEKLTLDEVAKMINSTPDALEEFEEAYKKASIIEEKNNKNFFNINSRQASKQTDKLINTEAELEAIISKSVAALIDQTSIWTYDSGMIEEIKGEPSEDGITKEVLRKLPKKLRPDLTSNLMKIDIKTPTGYELLDMYNRYVKESDPEKKEQAYQLFRVGLDTLDLDGITYKILECNYNTMGYWLPKMIEAIEETESFLKIPKTTIVKVPLTLLQLTRCEYFTLSATTHEIVNRWAKNVFNLEANGDYFIKTGTYSSKFDFRNARVKGEEIKELGDYLLFIHFQALQMASYLVTPRYYGVSTTNEWVVRNFIEDKENNPCIYHGLPLHTEYRVFADFDAGKVIGISPYWEPETMKNRFSKESDSDSADNKHDYVIYSAHENRLMERYNSNKDEIIAEVEKLLPNVNLEGQWSIDIMQNGDDFYFIDMAEASLSALVECVPKELLRKNKEDWIPKLEK